MLFRTQPHVIPNAPCHSERSGVKNLRVLNHDVNDWNDGL